MIPQAAGNPDDWHKMIKLDLEVPMRLTRRLSPAMVRLGNKRSYSIIKNALRFIHVRVCSVCIVLVSVEHSD